MWSTCPKCEGHSFRIQEVSPSGSAFKLNFVQCSGCGAPVGIVDFYNTGQLLKQQEKAIHDLTTRLSHIEHAINQIAYVLNNQR